MADVFENFQSMYLEIYEFDPGRSLTRRELAWKAVLKTTKLKLDLLTDTDMLLMLYNGIRG